MLVSQAPAGVASLPILRHLVQIAESPINTAAPLDSRKRVRRDGSAIVLVVDNRTRNGIHI